MNCDIIKLLHTANQRVTEAWETAAAPGGLTPRQFVVLEAVAGEEGLSQTELVKRTGIDRSTLSDIVRRMSKHGLLKRERSKGDDRAYSVHLEPKGRDIIKQAEAASERAVLNLVGHMPKKQVTALEEALRALSGGNPSDKTVDRAA